MTLRNLGAWYTPERAAMYDGAGDLVLANWHSLLAQRQGLLKGPDNAYSGFKTIEQDPLACRVAPVGLPPPVREQNPLVVLDLADLYKNEPWASQVAQVVANYERDQRDVLLDRLLGRTKLADDIQTVHQVVLECAGDDNPDAKELLELFRPLRADVLVHLTVDLDRGDYELLTGFQRWLRTEREKMRTAGIQPTGVPRGRARKKVRFSPADIARWGQLRVLAAIDIELACRYYGWTQPTAQQLGALLFPSASDIDTTDKVRQQVKPLVRRLLSDASLDAMRIQRQHEIGDPSAA